MANINDYTAAIVGGGGVSAMHAVSLKTIGVRLAAVCDILPERAAARANEWACDAYTDYKAMIKAGGFQVLHICLPHYLHAPVAIEAVRHQLHVLTEKPMALSVADASAMIENANNRQVSLGVIFQNRYNPGSVLIKKALDSGALGRVLSGWFRVTWHRDASYYINSGWRGKWATEGGGVIINQTIHTFDLMNYFLGGRPEYVETSTANRAHPMIEVEDVAEGIIAYPNNCMISFYVNTIFPYDAPVMLELICEKGRVTLTGERAEIRYADGRVETADRDADAAEYPGMKDYWGVSHIRQIRAFYESLANGRQPVINGVEALKTQRLINAVYQSANEKKRVNINENI